MLRNSKVLVLVLATAGLAACATKPQRSETRETRTREVAQAPRRDAGTNVAVQADRDSSRDVTPIVAYDYGRRTDLQSSLTARLDAAGREITYLRSASAPRSDCERRMRYLEAVRESATEHVAKLSDAGSDEWGDKRAEAEEAVSTLEVYLSKDRADCVTGNTVSGTR